MADKTVAVVGGGLGGLSAAIRLGKLGFKVSLFEKNRSLGGKMNQRTHGTFRFDTGPSLLTMPFVVDELFHFAGSDRQALLEFLPIDPICQYFYKDGTRFNARMNLTEMLDEIERVFPEEKKSYQPFLEYTQKIFDTSAEVFLFTPMHEISKLINLKTFFLLFKAHQIDPFRTVDQAVKRYFRDPRLVQIFNRYSTYNGSNPFKAPATLNIIPYVENVLGGYYIRGGMYRLVEEMEKLAVSLGIKIFTETEVEKIEHHGKKIRGLRINNDVMPFDYVICNADVVDAFDKLIEGEDKTTRKLHSLEPSLSGLVFLWSIKGNYPELEHHNIFFSNDYHSEFKQIFDKLEAPDDPTVYIAISSRSDADHAPKDHENWFVLINMPYLTGNEDWPEVIDRLRQSVLQKLRTHGITMDGSIMNEEVLTPQDFYRLYRSNRGSIYGLSSNSPTTAFTRPRNRSTKLKGLFFAGGSVHPGGGIPLVLLSGKMTAELIAEQEGIKTENDLSFFLEQHKKN